MLHRSGLDRRRAFGIGGVASEVVVLHTVQLDLRPCTVIQWKVNPRSLDDFLKAANELVEAIRAGSDPTPKAFRQQRMSVVSPAK